METSLFAALTLLSILYSINFEKRKNRICFLLVSVFNSFLRPEGAIFSFILISFLIIKKIKGNVDAKFYNRIKNAFSKDIITVLVVFFMLNLGYLIFRLLYYGYPFPNTYYAKTEFSFQFLNRGVDYFLHFAKQFMLYGFFAIPLLIRLVQKKTEFVENILLWFVISCFLLVIIIGGDVLPINRFFLPVIPIVFILFINSFNKVIEEYLKDYKAIILKYVIVVLLVCYSIINYNLLKPEMMEKRAYEVGLVSKMKIYAEFVKKITSNSKQEISNVKVAMSTIGAFSFYSGVEVIDLVGLTNEYIAHNPKETEGIDEQLPVLWKERHYNADYTLACKPDYIIFPAGAKPSAFAECAIYLNPEFYKNYYTQLFYSEELKQLLPIFTRKEKIRKELNFCNYEFLKYYLLANNYLLSMLQNKDRVILKKIISNLDMMEKLCPERASESKTLKGMAFYHLGNNIIAEKYFIDAIQMDPANSIAMFYLMNTYRRLGKHERASQQLFSLQKFSPYSLPATF